MTNPERVNPEVILKAAYTAIHSRTWEIIYGGGIGYRFGVSAYDDPLYHFFNPITSDADAWALERALKKEGWKFYAIHCHPSFLSKKGDDLICVFGARNIEDKSINDESDTLLLLKCVAALHSIPLY